MSTPEKGIETPRTKEVVLQEFADFCKAQLEQVSAEPSGNWMSEEDALERIRLRMKRAKEELRPEETI
ncbi:MAG: hypothetical protein UU95_C0016G0025 [Parcubacteria group bacterium GW2011_GWC2_42_12]|uniref:Uncharacterized protein n=1 Tax=Candidatus Falkowbacteria bacterium RIFCSPHIGHO2_02_FULL_42_9 TaxID=1797986 RepID=A0A1F5S715_9BACT|nr:MAG: hypothetical protein UU95_C0016G0025 [Parcubacteria group bacterium GW2011_GWC2_42_12]OGF22071.1 MAG: hypothetical protein A3D45_01635 [Candidatus Falkowbacteria bacterium RIFCSPHIGHO2_02_FULL_42_9]HBO85288.1 hypothetical protein [Deltaproteobacteria bacterium]